MRVLVTWGSKRGGTAEIASTISDELKAVGVEVALMPASGLRELRGYDAAIIGGALYGNRWHRDARRLVTRHIAGLRRIPVCLFSSGPLDSSAATWRGGGISNLSLRGGRVVRASRRFRSTRRNALVKQERRTRGRRGRLLCSAMGLLRGAEVSSCHGREPYWGRAMPMSLKITKPLSSVTS